MTARLVREFGAQHRYAPDQRALHRMPQFANHVTRQGTDEGALYFGAVGNGSSGPGRQSGRCTRSAWRSLDAVPPRRPPRVTHSMVTHPAVMQ